MVNPHTDQNDEEPSRPPSIHRNGENLHATTFTILMVFLCVYAQQVAGWNTGNNGYHDGSYGSKMEMKALQMRMHSVKVYSVLRVFDPRAALGGMVG